MTAEDPASVRSVITQFIDSWNRHDMLSLAALFAEDADFVDVLGNWFRDPEAIQRALAERHATVFRGSRFQEKEVAIRFQETGLAVVHAVIELSGASDRRDEPLPTALGVMTFVVVRVDGDW